VDVVLTWAWQALSLFAGTFLQEDAAMLGGAYLVVERGFPTILAFISLFAGVVAGDCLIYGIGAAAHRSRTLQKLLRRFDMTRVHGFLDRRLIWAVAVCRVIPTLTFPAFAACGYTGVPFRRFAFAAMATGLVYVLAMLVLLIGFGRSVPEWAQNWAWIGLALLVGCLIVGRRLITRRFGSNFAVSGGWPADGTPLVTHVGMPALSAKRVRVALSERIPMVLYYVPLVAQWFWLALKYRGLTVPTTANPLIESGGLMGESKAACMAMAADAPAEFMARTGRIERKRGQSGIENALRQARRVMTAHGLEFPVIAKPDIGWRGFGVRKVVSEADLALYLESYPNDQTIILQEYVPWHGEAAVFYVRLPGQASGYLFSTTLRYFPFVVGDGESTLETLILASPRTRWTADLHLSAHAPRLRTVPGDGEIVRLATVGSNRVGGLYVNAARYVTPEMTARFDEIARRIPEFWFGRFDVRFETLEQFQRGESFKIVEINGAGAEAVHIWDPNVSVLEGYRVLFRQQALMFRIGAANRRRGFRPQTPLQLIRCQQKQTRLHGLYPASG